MIPENFIEQWRSFVKWRMVSQVEQDLVLSRALVNLYNEPYIKDALVFRGGTALNKLFLKPPARYSEDIDFVQKRAEPIGKTIDSIRTLLKPWLGDPKWKITERSAKLIYKYESINKVLTKLKIEINTTEHFQVLPLRIEKFDVQNLMCNLNGLMALLILSLTKLMNLWQLNCELFINAEKVVIYLMYGT